MKQRLISLACWFGAIVGALSLAVLTGINGWFGAFALVSIVWAIIDSKSVRLWRYHTGISGGPTALFILLLIFGWPIVFPWYLGIRLKILFGVARLRAEYQSWQMSDPVISPNGLLQPWRGRRL